MAKREIRNEDGIYPQTVIPLTEDMPPEDVALFLKKFCRPNTLDSFLADIQNDIKPLLADLTDQCGTDRQEAARELSMRIKKLYAGLFALDAREAARQGIAIGRLAERIHAMQFEPQVAQVKRATRKLRAAAIQNQHSTEQIDAAIQLFNKLMASLPTPKKAVVYRKVLKKTGVPDRTLRRWLKKKNP